MKPSGLRKTRTRVNAPAPQRERLDRFKLTARTAHLRFHPLVEGLEDRIVPAGEFTDLGNLGMTDTAASAVAWGDYDGDGDLDALVASSSAAGTRIYRNDSGTFTVAASLTAVSNGAAAWGDFDRDGDLDVLLAGSFGGSSITQVWRNDAGSFFNINASLPAVTDAAVAWGDYDNDGDLDILLAGQTNSSTLITRVYQNQGGTFTDINAGLVGSRRGAVSWGDYDKDGDLDILVSGLGAGTMTHIYRNDGSGLFTDINAAVPSVDTGSSAWGDYDGDGDLDILLAGLDPNNARVTEVYRNDNGLSFTLVDSMLGVKFCNVSWGDYDNDGDLDALVSGFDEHNHDTTLLYRRDGDTFTEVGAGLPAVEGVAAWGDYDNDGDLDIILSGGSICHVLRNNSIPKNTLPNTPAGLSVTELTATSAHLTWTASTDAQTPSTGLSFVLRVGTTPGGSEVISPMSNPVSGLRRLAERGPVQTTSWLVTGLTGGVNYYWSVQAMDSAYAASAFASESTFIFNTPPVLGGTGQPGGQRQRHAQAFCLLHHCRWGKPSRNAGGLSPGERPGEWSLHRRQPDSERLQQRGRRPIHLFWQ